MLTTLGATASFQTDTDISGNQTRGERTLQKWVPEGPDHTDFSLDSNVGAGWDQFTTNHQLFGAKSTYDENLYTTTIDRNAPSYKRREAEAERIAREIESSTATNAHVREERGQGVENEGEDEEDKYSGVRRGGDDRSVAPLPVGGPNKYTPPARRPPTGQPTVPGAPVDTAIIEAKLSQPDAPPRLLQDTENSSTTETKSAPKPAVPSVTGSRVEAKSQPAPSAAPPPPLSPVVEESKDHPSSKRQSLTTTNKSVSPPTKILGTGPTEDVEVKVLNQFRQFADLEKQRVIERRKAQASQDRTAKLNELRLFSKSFKLKTPIPRDMVGILAKDPVKQEAIIEKAQKEAQNDDEEARPGTASPSATSSTAPAAPPRKPEAPPPTSPSVPDRPTFNRTRGGYPQAAARSDRPNSQQQQPPLFPSRGGATATGSFAQRFGPTPDRKGVQAHPIPAPIPIVDGRVPPSGPMAEQGGMASPQRSNLHTPTSAASSKFNLNVKASEFRPNAAAPTFNPVSSTHTPSSPASVQRAGSISRAATPSTFFGARKPKPASERPSLTHDFNPIERMRGEVRAKKASDHGNKGEEGQPKDQKDYAANGGIPHAFQTIPRWVVKAENAEKTYLQAFERPLAPVASPAQSRSGSTQHIPYQGPVGGPPNGPAGIPHISTPQHVPHAGPHQYAQQYDDGHHRMPLSSGSPAMFPSPNISSRQLSAYASPMGHPAQLSYVQQPYFGAPVGQMPIQMRPYPGTPGMMHAQIGGQMTAPMMVQQPSNGPYMTVPQQFTHPMSMYSPNPAHVYPQQNGYSSPGRVAPMMMQQGSQQGHAVAPNMMYTLSAQGTGGPMAYPQQQGPMGMVRGGYAGHHAYGSSPHQPYPMAQRTISSGYGQKVLPQPMQHGPPLNVPQQPAAYSQMEVGQDETK